MTLQFADENNSKFFFLQNKRCISIWSDTDITTIAATTIARTAAGIWTKRSTATTTRTETITTFPVVYWLEQKTYVCEVSGLTTAMTYAR